MKISKVDHTKSGVGVQEKKAKGILYANPKKGAEDAIYLKRHVEKLNEKAQRLYSFFNQTGIDRQKDRQERERYQDIKRLSVDLKKKVLINGACGQQEKLDAWIELQKTHGNDTRQYRSFQKLPPASIDAMIDDCLRNSLKKYVRTEDSKEKAYVPDLMKKLFRSVILADQKNAQELTAAEKKALLAVWNEDYGKKDAMKKIVRSIELQNVRVKCAQWNGKARLCLSNADHPKKGVIFTFLRKFAAAENEKERKRLLGHMKRLILLFYCGTETYAASSDDLIPAFHWGLWEEEAARNFDETAYGRLQDIASLQAKKKTEQVFREKTRIGNEIKQLQKNLKMGLKEKIAASYREAVCAEGITKEDIFWIGYIEEASEKILVKKSGLNPVKLSVSYLCEHTYREWLSYICMKFMDMGKGVYHFASPKNLTAAVCGDEGIGEVRPEYREGISSFDYERIKAEETVQRDVSLYISFAANNYAMSVFSDEVRAKPGREDILSVSENIIEKEMFPDADRRILRFFGGWSAWEQAGTDEMDGFGLVLAVKEAFVAVRNQNFHYTKLDSHPAGAHQDILKKIFSRELAETGGVFRKKYYSNNVWMFYGENDICALMDALYSTEPKRPPQIPSFQKIIHKKNLEEAVHAFILGKKKKKLQSAKDALKCMETFRSTFFFILKEIYYYGFLQEENLLELFCEELEQEEKPKNKNALDNFKQRIREIRKNNPKISFGEVCQQVMTDYNQQNQGVQTVASGQKEKDGEKYKHFPMLLYLYIRTAFLKYLKSKECYRFLRAPEYQKDMAREISQEEFCSHWQPHLYDGLKEKADDAGLLSWFTTAHFLNPKQLNMLLGCIKSYMQYLCDIDRRAADTKNRTGADTGQKLSDYRDVVSALELAGLFCGSVTNCFEDYFQDEEDYAGHLAQYVDFGAKGKQNRLALKEFCSRSVRVGNETHAIGLYCDEMNPIVNRNMVYADMYGSQKILKNCFTKVTEKEIREYYRQKQELSEAFQQGACRDFKEEEKLRRFQNKKNHVELTEITAYSEIVNDFIGQLISWAYLRERDLMYFQLGFHYTRLFYSDCVERESPWRKLKGEGIQIEDGAILYQIIAMYTYGLPVITLDEKGDARKGKKTASNAESVNLFYKEYCKDGGEVYEMGLCLFENVATEHSDIVSMRNYIDHFKYYSLADRSMLDLYSDVYDRFFNYDSKLKKSVAVVFQNILLRHFVQAKISMGRESRRRYDKREHVKNGAAKLFLNGPLDSLEFQVSEEIKQTLPKKNGKGRVRDTITARDDNFLIQLEKILSYKE